MRYQFSGGNSDDGNISFNGQVVPINDTFRYLISILQSDRGIDEDVSHIIRVRWVKLRQTFDILYDKKISNKLNGKFYMTMIRSAMMYDVEY
jgi:hypothetical protein